MFKETLIVLYHISVLILLILICIKLFSIDKNNQQEGYTTYIQYSFNISNQTGFGNLSVKLQSGSVSASGTVGDGSKLTLTLSIPSNSSTVSLSKAAISVDFYISGTKFSTFTSSTPNITLTNSNGALTAKYT